MKILVTGGAGYIGSVVAEQCVAAGHETHVIDNLTTGHAEAVEEAARLHILDIADEAAVEAVLRENAIDAVIHMAASSLVAQSVAKPALYYQNNVTAGVSLLNSMRRADVKKLIFSSTAAVYGEPEKQPIVETDATRPTNPYGATKLEFEKMLRQFDETHGLRYVTLRYFNAGGATARCGEMHDPETHLIPLVLDVADGTSEFVQIFGDDYDTPDGTCVRDYVHVSDLSRAHLLALGYLESRVDSHETSVLDPFRPPTPDSRLPTSSPSRTYNLGGGSGHSVLEVINTARRITARPLATRTVPRRPGDPPTLIASSTLINRELAWKPELSSLDRIISSAWKWRQNKKPATL